MSPQTIYYDYLPMVVKVFVPDATTSYYIGSTDTAAAYALGQLDGTIARYSIVSFLHVVVLDFGTPGLSSSVQGAYMPAGKGFISASQASAVAQQYALGWTQSTANTTHKLWLAIGVNNYGTGVLTTNAAAWATAFSSARTGVQNLRLRWVFAFDAEMEWNTAAISRQYADAYMNGQHGCTPGSGLSACVYDFGNANCGFSPTNQACAYSDWYKNDIWYLAGGQKRAGDFYPFAAALPEIYNTLGNNARQWQSVSLYGATTSGKYKLYFAGSLTTAGACAQTNNCPGYDNPPQVGYYQLDRWLNGDTRTAQFIPTSTDIRYQVYP